jgi:hypothetical protein
MSYKYVDIIFAPSSQTMYVCPELRSHGYELNGWKALALHVTIAKEDAFDVQCII